MNPFAPFLEKHGVVILDGALATELERRGADLRDPLWSAKLLLENAELIRQVHCDYFAAGADVVTTASYQATIPGLMQRGMNHTQAANVLRRSVALAREARDAFLLHENRVAEGAAPTPRAPLSQGERGEKLIAASIGCYGAYLHDGSEYRGDYGLSVRELVDWHRSRVEILADSGADLLACETVPCLTEAEALVKLLSEFPRMPAWISFSCQDDRRICRGESFVEAVQMVQESPNIVAVGVNCTAPRHVDGLIEAAAGHARKPLIVYPTSGERWDAQRRCWNATAAEPDWRTSVVRWHRVGARIIGGCCRTTPALIRDISQALQRTLT